MARKDEPNGLLCQLSWCGKALAGTGAYGIKVMQS